MIKPIFISFRYSDRTLRNDLLAMCSGIRFEMLEQSAELRPVHEIKADIQRILGGCRGLIVLVGDDTHNSPWLDYEVAAAHGLGIPARAMRHPRSKGGLPNAHKALQIIEWGQASLRDAIKSW